MAESHWVFRRNPMTYNASNGNGEFDNNSEFDHNSVCLAAHRHQKKSTIQRRANNERINSTAALFRQVRSL
jgi:hypothetical protein